MNTFTAVMLYFAIITGQGKADIQHSEPMPDMETCIMELGKLMRHQFPDSVGAQGLSAGCTGKLVAEKPS